MSRSGSARLVRESTCWLLVLLCTALLAWRIDYRIEQYHHSKVGSAAVVAFFDANERNIATLDEIRFSERAHFVAGHPPLLLDVYRARASAAPLTKADWRWPEDLPNLPGIVVSSVSLFPNPPPAVLA